MEEEVVNPTANMEHKSQKRALKGDNERDAPSKRKAPPSGLSQSALADTSSETSNDTEQTPPNPFSEDQIRNIAEVIGDPTFNLRLSLLNAQESLQRSCMACRSRRLQGLWTDIYTLENCIHWLFNNGEEFSGSKPFVGKDAGRELLPDKEKWNTRHDYKYKRVKVLLVDWEISDISGDDLANLEEVFFDRYNYEVWTFKIPDLHPSASLTKRVIQFIDDNDLDTLLIFYYAGHGTVDVSTNITYWSGVRNHGAPSMPAGVIQTLFEESESDALLFFDACNAANNAITKTPPASSGITELIASSGFRNRSCGQFCVALFDILNEQDEFPLSVSELFGKVLGRLRSPRDLDSSQATPVHCTLTSDKSGRQIMLRQLAPADTPEVSPAGEEQDKVHAAVVISLGLSDSTLATDPEGWKEVLKKWLLAAPPEVKSLLGTQVVWNTVS